MSFGDLTTFDYARQLIYSGKGPNMANHIPGLYILPLHNNKTSIDMLCILSSYIIVNLYHRTVCEIKTYPN